jgi:hypothetical protein
MIEALITPSGASFSDVGRNSIKKLINKFGFDEVYESTRLSYDQYHTDIKSIDKVFEYIHRICGFRQKSKNDVWFAKRRYISGIVKNRHGIYNPGRLNNMLCAIVNDETTYEDVSQIAKDARNWTEFWAWINETYGSNY